MTAERARARHDACLAHSLSTWCCSTLSWRACTATPRAPRCAPRGTRDRLSRSPVGVPRRRPPRRLPRVATCVPNPPPCSSHVTRSPPLFAGNATLQDMEAYVAGGFTAVLPKPFSTAQLRAALQPHVVAAPAAVALGPTAVASPVALVSAPTTAAALANAAHVLNRSQ